MLSTAFVGTLIAVSCHFLLLVVLRSVASPVAARPSALPRQDRADTRMRSPTLRELLDPGEREPSKLRESKWPSRRHEPARDAAVEPKSPSVFPTGKLKRIAALGEEADAGGTQQLVQDIEKALREIALPPFEQTCERTPYPSTHV